MSEKDALRKLEEAKKERDQRYLLLKGQIQGIRLSKLNPQGKAFLGIYEMMIDESQRIWNDLARSAEQQIRTNQKVSNLEARIGELEDNILQLRETLDRMVQDR
jgi:uncharacterized protein YceH (UPF0502 family)